MNCISSDTLRVLSIRFHHAHDFVVEKLCENDLTRLEVIIFDGNHFPCFLKHCLYPAQPCPGLPTLVAVRPRSSELHLGFKLSHLAHKHGIPS